MTDLSKHLKGIRKILRQSIERDGAAGQIGTAALRNELRRFLPASYGLAQGQIRQGDNCSVPFQIIIYDVPLSNGNYDETSRLFQIEHVLGVLDIQLEHSAASFTALLANIAHLKALKPYRRRKKSADSSGAAKIPADRLPYTLLCFDRFSDMQHADEKTFLQIAQWLSAAPVEHQTEEIDITGQQIHFLNPLLNAAEAHEAGLSRTPNLVKPQACYVCKARFYRRHFFYPRMCIRCGDLNYAKRLHSVDLNGYTALVTGARVKIGYAVVLRLLRAGATVIAVTRFPHDAARRYASEADYALWQNRLHIYGVDLRQIPRLEVFVEFLYQNYSHLDILVNNAAQTIKRPPAYYAHLKPLETAAQLPAHLLPLLKNNAGFKTLSPHLTATHLLTGETDADFPAGEYDSDGQQVDKRSSHSWVQRLDEISAPEILEVHLVNAVAPAVLSGQLKALMQQSPHPVRHIINVSAVEGQFASYKQGLHPHTSMAKAALNMLTRTTAEDFAASNIFVNSVDPGWVSDQTPYSSEERRNVLVEQLPIDMVDAAARICDPIFAGLETGQHFYGKLLKDYAPDSW